MAVSITGYCFPYQPSKPQLSSRMDSTRTNNLSRRWRSQGSIILIICLAFGLRIFRLANQSYWWDELSTVGRSAISMSEMLKNLINNTTHMPLYFTLMQGWASLGESEFILRYFSVIMGVLTVALIARTGRFIGGWPVGIGAALLLAISPFNIWYSQEARMYSLVAFSILAANWFILRILHGGGRNHWIGYAVAMFISLYSHYLTVFILIAHYVFFSLHYRIDKRLLRQWLLFGGAVGLLYGLWIAAILLNGGFRNAPIGWIPAARWSQPFFTLLSLGIGPTINPANPLVYIVLMIYLIALVYGFFTYFRSTSPGIGITPERRQMMTYRLLLLWLFLPIALVYLISLDLPIPEKRSLYMDRYLITCLPALILLGAWGLATISKIPRWRWVLPAGIVLITIITATSLRNLYFDPLYARDNWRQAMEYMAENWQQDDIYLVKPSQTIVAYHYGHKTDEYAFVPYLSETEDRKRFFEEDIDDWVASLAENSNRAWLIMAFENANPHGFPQDRNEATLHGGAGGSIEVWMDESCRRLDQWRFTGIRLTLYDLATCQTRKSAS